MPTLFRLDSSIRVDGSVTRSIASTLQSALTHEIPDLAIVQREIGLTPLPADAWANSATAAMMPIDQRAPEHVSAAALASELADEIIGADILVIGAPLYNWGVSQHLKTWFDLAITDPRLSPYADGTIAGRPTFLAVARGGAYGPGTPREGWDHATGWITRILRDVWRVDLQVIEAELTLADTNPAMAEFRALAAQNLEQAHASAAEHGRRLAARFSLPVAA